jgi:hypothetical protein
MGAAIEGFEACIFSIELCLQLGFARVRFFKLFGDARDVLAHRHKTVCVAACAEFRHLHWAISRSPARINNF